MQQQKHRRGGQDSEGVELDRLLDAALNRYAAVEPREGLQERILAHVRSEFARVPSQRWWRWGLAAAAVAALAMIIAISWPRSRPQSIFAQRPSVSGSQKDQQPLLHGGAGAEQKAAIRRPKRRLHAATRTDAAKAVSKLDQFPSPQPLTKEERMLAEYVGQHYHEAVLIARAQEEASRKDLEEERRYSKGNRDDDDDDDDDSQQSK